MGNKSSLTQEQIDEIKEKLLGGVSIRNILKDYSVSQSKINDIIEMYNIKRPITNTEIMRRKLPGYLELENQICNNYKESLVSCEELGKKFGLGLICIINILKRNGIERNKGSDFVRKYTLNESFFETIDTKEKAYMLGFLFADGCIVDSKSKNEYKVEISLQEDDKEILDKFKNLIEYSGNLQKINPPKEYPNRKTQYKLTVNNKTFYMNLYNNGLVPRKSYTAKFPFHIRKDLYKSFILGVYDGDGCVYCDKKNQSHISFTGTLEICDAIGDIIESELGIKKHIYLAQNSIETDINTRVLMFGGNVQVKKFLDWLYLGEPIYLQRKYNKYCSIFNTSNLYQNNELIK